MIKKLFLYAGLILAFTTSCSKKTTQDLNPTPIDPVVVSPAVYSITEDFENSPAKGAYAVAEVKMPTGSWTLDDALIGNLANDLKNGQKSVRLKAGKVT